MSDQDNWDGALPFRKYPKTTRLDSRVVITEKIDGTNAAVAFNEDGELTTQSRRRLITPDDDNYGFSAWAHEHSDILWATLGPGHHFGEWWGSGIQRGYGLPPGDRRFSLFNTERWASTAVATGAYELLVGLGAVPVLYDGPFSMDAVNKCLRGLKKNGSFANPGFANPEGVCVHYPTNNLTLKAYVKDLDVTDTSDVVVAVRKNKPDTQMDGVHVVYDDVTLRHVAFDLDHWDFPEGFFGCGTPKTTDCE